MTLKRLGFERDVPMRLKVTMQLKVYEVDVEVERVVELEAVARAKKTRKKILQTVETVA